MGNPNVTAITRSERNLPNGHLCPAGNRQKINVLTLGRFNLLPVMSLEQEMKNEEWMMGGTVRNNLTEDLSLPCLSTISQQS